MNSLNNNQIREDISNIFYNKALWLIIIIASFFRLFQLNSQLWLDEFSVIEETIRISWLEIVTVWPGAATHILFEVLANWSSKVFGANEFAIRLPAALFGIAGVVIVSKLATRIFSAKAGLFIAALLAFSYHHIFYSQNARGYTALIFFFLWSSYLFIRIIENGRIEQKAGLLYCLVTVLTCYSQPFGVFIPAAQFIVAVGLIVIHSFRAKGESFPIKPFILWMFTSAIVTLMLYAPFYDGMVGHAKMNIDTPAEGPRFDLSLVIEIVEGLSAAFYGYVGLTIVTIAGLIGMFIWIRANAVSVFVLMLPIFVQAVVFLIMGVGIHPRYFAIAIPVIYIAGGITFFVLSDYLLKKLFSDSRSSHLYHSLILLVVVIVSSYPLIKYYSVPKQDFQGALKIIKQVTKKEDIKIGIQTVGPIMRYYGQDFIRVDELKQLQTLENSGERVWVVMTLERIMYVADPALVQYIRKNYKLLNSLPGTVGDGSIQIYKQLN